MDVENVVRLSGPGLSVEAFQGLRVGELDEAGRRRAVCNGHGPERSIRTGIEPIEVRRPKVRDRGASIY